MRLVTSFLAGLVFGVGLIVSGMAQPSKVLGFLDITGRWDPSLGLVMIGAVAAGLIAFRLARGRQRSLLGLPMHLPTARDIDRRLVFGSLTFGIGWGFAGLCPGPALVDLGTGQAKAFVFVVAMLLGMGIFEWVQRRKARAQASADGRFPTPVHSLDT
jgi:uncharacterized membrane protein YedE/YeeE